MGRPPLAPGTHGRISLHHDRVSGRVRARARFRDYDGHNRAVTRWGATEAEASARLLVSLDEQAAFPVGQWAAGARLREVVPLWQADLDASPLGHSQPAQPAAPCPACAPTPSVTAPSPTTRCATPDPSPVPTARYAR